MAFTAQQQREYRARRKAEGNPCPSGKSGKSGKAKYRQAESLFQRKLDRLATRQFCAWDSEGINFTHDDGLIEHRTAFVANSLGDELAFDDGLSLDDSYSQIIPFIYESALKHSRDLIHVWFSASYDWTMILRGIDGETIREIHTAKGKRGVFVRVGRDIYDIKIARRRMLTIRKVEGWKETESGKHSPIFGRTVNMVDTFGFYQQSFVAAIRHNLGEHYHELRKIIEGKKERGTETYLRDETKAYCRAELRALVKLCERLRDDLVTCEIPLRAFWGAGAIASTMLSENGMDAHINAPYVVTHPRGDYRDHRKPKPPAEPSLADACLYAFKGARIEMVRYGYARDVHDYDVNSCYPFFMSQLPSFAADAGEWRYRKLGPFANERARHLLDRAQYDGERNAFTYDFADMLEVVRSLSPFSLIEVDYVSTNTHSSPDFFPFAHRDLYSRIWYPAVTRGWVHRAEVLAWLESSSIYLGSADKPAHMRKFQGKQYLCDTKPREDRFSTILAAWEWIPNDAGVSPWRRFILDGFNRRAELKRAYGKGGPEKILKLGLNSLYGKTAQRVGHEWKRDENQEWYMKPPRFQDLYMAGFITANARASLYRLAATNPRAVISFATDGLTASEPLACDNIGAELGQWEYTHYNEGIFLQAGMYTLRRGDQYKQCTRGFHPKESPADWWDKVVNAWRNGQTALKEKQTVFYTTGLALAKQEPLDHIGQWVEIDRDVQITCLGQKRGAGPWPQKNPHQNLCRTVPNAVGGSVADLIDELTGGDSIDYAMSHPSRPSFLSDDPRTDEEYELAMIAQDVADMRGESFDAMPG